MSNLAELDSVESTIEHAEHIRSKLFLRRIYEEHYNFFREQLKGTPKGIMLEIGSGGGFSKQVIPELITSDVVTLPTIQLVSSALSLPFKDQTLAGIVLMNVFHHLQDCDVFLNEVNRCLKPGGKLIMIEPANTLFSRFIYRNFHHEPFEPSRTEWTLESGGRMSMANGALPWIVFSRDRERLTRTHPNLRVEELNCFMPLRYLLSGGVSKPQLLPSWSYQIIRAIESLLSPFNNWLGLFMRIVVRKEPG